MSQLEYFATALTVIQAVALLTAGSVSWLITSRAKRWVVILFSFPAAVVVGFFVSIFAADFFELRKSTTAVASCFLWSVFGYIVGLVIGIINRKKRSCARRVNLSDW